MGLAAYLIACPAAGLVAGLVAGLMTGQAARGAPAVVKISQRRREQRLHAQLVYPGRPGLGQPGGQLALQCRHLAQPGHVRRRDDERAQPRPRQAPRR